MSIDISNVINASLTSTPSGLQEANINSLMLFSTEIPSNSDAFRIYLSASDVQTDFGTSSITAAMANNIFAQSPNILSGGGRLIIAPLISAVSAGSGDVATADIFVNLATIQAVTNGDIRIVLNGSNIDLTGLDFSATTTFTDIAVILQKGLPDAIVTNIANTGFRIKSKKVGATISDVSMVQLPAGSGEDLSAASAFNVAGTVLTVGTDASGEIIADAILRLQDAVQFVGIISNLNMEDLVVTALASTIQATDYIYLHSIASSEDIAGIATTIQAAGQTRTRIVIYSSNLDGANLTKAAYAGNGFSVQFNGSATTRSMHLKQLANVTPDASITQTILNAADTAGVDVYVSIGGSISAILSSGNNGYFDSIYNKTWFKSAIETSGLNYLRKTNTKIPQNEQGMNGLKDAYAQVCIRAINNGFLSAGLSWSSSQTFGSPEDLKRNISDTGYYIFSLPVALQAVGDRALRKAPLVQIAAKEGGAIHSSDVNINIEA